MHDEFYCFATDPVKPQRSMFAAQSSYEATRGARIDPNVSGELLRECICAFSAVFCFASSLHSIKILDGFSTWRSQSYGFRHQPNEGHR
jgi:hypothetical protein